MDSLTLVADNEKGLGEFIHGARLEDFPAIDSSGSPLFPRSAGRFPGGDSVPGGSGRAGVCDDLDWDAQAEQITHPKGANEHLHYGHRKPWRLG